jgi:acyl phosphate:glycerol-3-phosphate acyltransferase
MEEVAVILQTVLLALGSYLIGSVPFSYLVARACGVDLRKVGSGNIGGANVWRSCGFGPFLIAVLLDIAKGAAMPLVAIYGFGLSDLAVLLVGIGAVLGHTFSVFMRFKGGKAVATSGGVLLAVFPLVMLVGLVAWVVAFGITRISSVGSLSAAAVAMAFAAAMLALGQVPLAYATFTWLAAALIFFLHRENIQRLMQGKENRFQKLW